MPWGRAVPPIPLSLTPRPLTGAGEPAGGRAGEAAACAGCRRALRGALAAGVGALGLRAARLRPVCVPAQLLMCTWSSHTRSSAYAPRLLHDHRALRAGTSAGQRRARRRDTSPASRWPRSGCPRVLQPVPVGTRPGPARPTDTSSAPQGLPGDHPLLPQARLRRVSVRGPAGSPRGCWLGGCWAPGRDGSGDVAPAAGPGLCPGSTARPRHRPAPAEPRGTAPARAHHGTTCGPMGGVQSPSPPGWLGLGHPWVSLFPPHTAGPPQQGAQPHSQAALGDLPGGGEGPPMGGLMHGPGSLWGPAVPCPSQTGCGAAG